MFLLTTHGTILVSDDRGTIRHERPDRIAPGFAALDVGPVPGDGGADYKSFLERPGSPEPQHATARGLPDIVLARTADLRTVTATRGDVHMTALPDGGVGFHATAAGTWELYVPLDADALRDFVVILTNTWVEASTKVVIRPGDLALREGWRLAIGQAVLDLRLQFPAIQRDLPFRLVGLHEGWRIATFHLLRPMMYFTAFRSPEVLAQLYLCLNSLIEFGRYRGRVHVVTDQDARTILSHVPALDPAMLSVQSLEPADWVGYVASKYVILECEAAYAHQPVVFNDPDMIFDTDIAPMLAAIAIADRITAPLEGGVLRSFPSLGQALYQRDGFDPGFANGFNAGTLGIPNLRAHGRTLELIRTVIVNHALLHGRDYHHWVDQEVANYVSFRFGHFDTHSISRHVRVGFPGIETTADGRCGQVHFWAGHPKSEVMATYADTLRAKEATVRHDRSRLAREVL